MSRNLYTKPEIILCTYIAIYGRDDFDEKNIQKLKKRSLSSIKMKVQNIASMLREEGYSCSSEVSSLTGLPTGQVGRRTNWEDIEPLLNRKRKEFFNECNQLFKSAC